jgi:ribosomal protein S18 acetylase RimI-like enzyme
VDIDKDSNHKKTNGHIASPVADEGKRHPFVGKHRGRHSDIDRCLHRDQQEDSHGKQFSESVLGIGGDESARQDDEDEPEYPVLYCYELQISHSYQGKGIGKHIMELLNQFQKSCQMKKVMLTCFKINSSAMNFYLKNGFYIDEYSPSKFGDIHCHYEILSNDKPKSKKKRM